MGIDAEMFVRTKESVTDDQIRRWGFELREAFGDIIWRDKKYNRPGIGRATKIEQDGPTIRPKTGETFLRLDLFCRYYGPDYERGPATDIIAIARWLEAKIPGAEVWYGGDSSGVLHEKFDVAARERLWRHFLENGHRPYTRSFGHGKPLACDFCKEPATEHMWGAGRVGFRCAGCDGHWVRDEKTGAVEPCDENWKPIETATAQSGN